MEQEVAMVTAPSQSLADRRKQFKQQQSTVTTRRQQAVCVRRAFKKYGSKANENIILDGLNMTVPKGTIYGLLGASGCGKTTLLSCIVGRRRLNSGEIWVLGGKPGSRGSGVPGPRIGYMPQEIALYGEFSIRETLIYFGWINGMTTEEVDEKVEFLLKFLMLPTASRLVKNLSGGQQRRVSFAAALVHEPELLILDEPTVGVDPVLRQSIWDHLVRITQGGKTTVIITTHYIEETRQAHIIGLMRGGYFLAEESPDKLMQQYGTETLEDVFLKLSVIQNMGKRRRSSILQDVTSAINIPNGAVNEAVVIDDEVGEISGEFGDNISMSSRGGRISIAPDTDTEIIAPDLPPDDDVPLSLCEMLKFATYSHMKAMIWKNFLWMWRNVPVLLFILGLPMMQIILFCWAIGHDPVGLRVAVYNEEINSTYEKCTPMRTCNDSLLSCKYLDELGKRKVDLVYHTTEDSAKNAVVQGDAWLAISFPMNYSDCMRARIDQAGAVMDYDVDCSHTTVWEDKSNQQISILLFRDLNYAFQDFLREHFRSCDLYPQAANFPVRFNDPVYGERIPNFTNFAAPGVILTVIFFLAVALTSGAMLMERNDGILERSLVSGITGVELLFSHVITQFLVVLCQTISVLVLAFCVFQLTINGEFGWVLLLTLLTGLCGMCFGFVVSCVCDNERSATYLALGSFLPIVMLCGIIWPIEGMYSVLKAISYVLPLTKSTECLRSILQRGWSIDEPVVYQGFISTLVWILIFLTGSILALKFKKG